MSSLRKDAARFVVGLTMLLGLASGQKQRSWLGSSMFVQGQAPVGRATGQCLAELGGKLYVFGGSAGANYLNDLSVYQPQTRTWTVLSNYVLGDTPSQRYGQAFIAAADKLFVFGGRSATGLAPIPTRSLPYPAPDLPCPRLSQRPLHLRPRQAQVDRRHRPSPGPHPEPTGGRLLRAPRRLALPLRRLEPGHPPLLQRPLRARPRHPPPAGARHRLRHGAFAARAHAGSQRDSDRCAQSSV